MGKKHVICAAEELRPGGRKIVKIGTRSIGIFNINGDYFALLNKCPHLGAELCEGPVCGTNKAIDAADGYRYEFVREGEILRCARHGWEFDIRTGENYENPEVKAKTYPVAVEDGQVVVSL